MSRSDHPPQGRSRHWHDWRWQMRHAVSGYRPCFAAFGISKDLFDKITQRYPVRITPYALSLLDPSNPRDPLNLQALPALGELQREAGTADDPFGERLESACCHGLKRRFPDRVLVMAHACCAMACRHCTRKNLLADAEVIRTPAQLAAAVAWVRSHPEVREVLISGGDPLLIADCRILALVKAFARLPQIDAVRIGTRVPVTLPMRVTAALAEKLGEFRKVWVNTQFNHAREITSEAAVACARLVDAGIPISNQSVLLKGVNDSADSMFALCAALQRIRVRPYYVFMCDPVTGIAHFRVPIAQARRIERELAARIGGLALPRFVMDLPGSNRKVPLS